MIVGKVQGPDRWWSVDSRALHHVLVEISEPYHNELYDNLRAHHVAARRPISWGWRHRGAQPTCPSCSCNKRATSTLVGAAIPMVVFESSVEGPLEGPHSDRAVATTTTRSPFYRSTTLTDFTKRCPRRCRGCERAARRFNPSKETHASDLLPC